MARASDGEGKRPAASRRGTGAIRVTEAPLAELSRDQLSAFLFVALTPDETRALVKQLGLGIPGFRTGSLGDVERCDVLADEIRARPGAGREVVGLLEKAFEGVPLARVALGPRGARDLLLVGGGDAALALSLWRVLSDADGEVRAVARPVLDDLAAQYFGPAGGQTGADAAAEMEDPAARADVLAGALADAERKVQETERRVREAEERGTARADEVRRKGEEQREKLQAALREARAQESRAVEEAARSREEAAQARADLGRARADLEALRGTDAVSEAQRARAEARDLQGLVGALEARLARAREREAELAGQVERAQVGRTGAPPPPELAPAQAEEPGEGGDLEVWLLPVYTREFYDSIDGWDRRIQRAAFKQAHLLALDHRHPSLRAIPLEGLPGYYRVRVATDVRLIYRRQERQNTVEILSLIDREDLDRYIRQAKTRG